MAIIYSYPKISSLAGNDSLIITDISDKKKPTKRVSLSQLRSFLRIPTSGPGGVVTKIIPGSNITISPVDGTGDVTINSTGSISGTGTTNALPIWSDGPNRILGNSVITFSSSPNLGEWNFNGSAINVGGNSFFKRVSIRGAGSNIVGDFTNFTFKNIMFYMSINPGNPAVETSRVWQGLYKNNTAVKNGLHWSFGSYSTSPNSAFIIGDDKSIQMPGYGSGTITGTKTYDLAVDTDGNVIETVNSDTGVTAVTLATGTSTGAPLSESIATRELTLTSYAYDGGNNIGYVPTGGTANTYLKGNGSWGAIPTGLQFQGTWDARNIAEGGVSDGGDPDLDGIAGAVDGWLYIVSTAGSAVPNGAATTPNSWNLGDWCIYNGINWTRVPATNAGVTSLTTTDGTYINLTPNTASTGSITVTADLSAQATGTSDVTTKFLTEGNKWQVPSYSPDPGLPAILTDGANPGAISLYSDVDAADVRSAIGAGTGDGDVTASSTTTFTNKSGSNSQWTNDEGYTTNTGTTTADNTQTFTNKSGSNSQWTNDEGYSTTTGTVTPSSTDTFTNKSGNISMWTNDSGYTTNTGTTTATNTQTFTNKSGNISQWTNDSGYITSESDTLLSVTQRGASTSVATNFTGSLTVNGTGAGAYFYVSGNAQSTAPPTSYDTGLAMAWNNSGGSRENEIYFATGSGATQAENDSTYFSFINRFNTSGTPVDTRVAKFYGNGDVDFLGKVFTHADVLAGSTKIIDFATSSVAGDATGFIGNYFTTHGSFANPTTTAATFYDQAGVGPTLSGYRVAIRNYDGTNMIASATFTDTSLTVVGDVIAYGSPSDKRLKENIKPIESALSKAMKLQGVTFDWKKSDSILDIKKDVGFIAQDVQKVIPELVRENKDGMLSMRHQGIAPILLEAIKELKAEIEELKLNKCNCNK